MFLSQFITSLTAPVIKSDKSRVGNDKYVVNIKVNITFMKKLPGSFVR